MKPIVSIYNKEYLLKSVVFLGGTTVYVIYTTVLAIMHHAIFTGAYLEAYVPTYLFAFAVVFVLLQGGTIRKITVTPENIIVNYFTKLRPLIIKHTDVRSVGQFASYDGGVNSSVKKYTQEQIELYNGKTILFSYSQFENYNELKNAIWNYRLAAFAKLNEPEPSSS